MKKISFTTKTKIGIWIECGVRICGHRSAIKDPDRLPRVIVKDQAGEGEREGAMMIIIMYLSQMEISANEWIFFFLVPIESFPLIIIIATIVIIIIVLTYFLLPFFSTKTNKKEKALNKWKKEKKLKNKL